MENNTSNSDNMNNKTILNERLSESLRMVELLQEENNLLTAKVGKFIKSEELLRQVVSDKERDLEISNTLIKNLKSRLHIKPDYFRYWHSIVIGSLVGCVYSYLIFKFV